MLKCKVGSQARNRLDRIDTWQGKVLLFTDHPVKAHLRDISRMALEIIEFKEIIGRFLNCDQTCGLRCPSPNRLPNCPSREMRKSMERHRRET
jgi:hypothetical protein